jgi:hypothetical protein
MERQLLEAAALIHATYMESDRFGIDDSGEEKMELSQETKDRVLRIFKEVDDRDAELRRTLTPEQYKRQAAETDLRYCRDKLDPNNEMHLLHPEIAPDSKVREAYEARIRDLTHFLETGRHLDEDEI